MRGKLMIGLALAALAVPVWAAHAPRKAAVKAVVTTGPVFRNVRVSLPQDFDVEYPAGPGADSVNANCRACHSPSMVLTQPPLSAEEWHKEVRKMIDVYKAPIAEDQVEAITGYLKAMPTSAGRKGA
ncbi:cytochrome c [Novosphingobium sp. KACC 22771]|uniref:cytochrome c n=1 Tax=Novosphingobium sp. KACC 22771 TaxID=3025670 RepID=UPI0023656272|nr:cytochrome c [Novosphingobium sp. KACC 22771]WDF75180.1 cytochrome c [Novosphingobium sp. KACC 22771]